MGIQETNIKVSDDELEKQYDIHCSDPIFAEKVFSNGGIKLFKSMIRQHAVGQLQFAASKSNIYMLIEQDHNFFELPSIYYPFDQVEDVTRLGKEMDGFISLFEQMDKLLDV